MMNLSLNPVQLIRFGNGLGGFFCGIVFPLGVTLSGDD